MGLLDKIEQAIKDPKNQERVKSAIANQTAKRKHTHPHGHHVHHPSHEESHIFEDWDEDDGSVEDYDAEDYGDDDE